MQLRSFETIRGIGQVFVKFAGGLACLLFTAIPASAQTQTWIQLNTPAAPAPYKGDSAIGYASASNRLVVWSGYANASDQNNALWVLSNANGTASTPPAWTQLIPPNVAGSPRDRTSLSSVYDQPSNRLFLFGGDTGCNFVNDVWVLNNADGSTGTPYWKNISITGTSPPGRDGNGLAYDSATDRLIVYLGASDNYGCVNNHVYPAGDVWILSNASGSTSGPSTWKQIPMTGSLPTGRRTNPMAGGGYDARNNRVVMFGGEYQPTQQVFDDVWVLTNANALTGNPTWVQLAPQGTPPAPRWAASCVYDPSSNRLIVFGGTDDVHYFKDVWILTNANGLGGTPQWQAVPFSSGVTPPGNESSVSAYDSQTNRMIVYGGEVNFGSFTPFTDAVWVLTGANGVSSGGSSAPTVTLSSTSLQFGNQNVSIASSAQTVTLTNTGTANLNITGITITGANSSDFIEGGDNCNLLVAPGASCTIRVLFRPTAAGVRTASLSVTDNAANSPQAVSLSGTGQSASTGGLPTLINKVTSNTSGLNNNVCGAPPPVTMFTSDVAAVWLYFDVNGASAGDAARADIYRPDGILYQSDAWNPISSVGANGYYCFSDQISISGTPAAAYSGTWNIRVFYNNAPFFTLSFTLTASSSPAVPVISTNGS